jgi:hypothetical protein
MKSKQTQTALPESASFTRYYEQDGMLRAYANRAMFLAILFGVIALGSLGFAIYVRVQPPTVIRVDKDGNAAVVGAAVRHDRTSELTLALTAQAAAPDGPAAEGIGPSDLEGSHSRRRVCRGQWAYRSGGPGSGAPLPRPLPLVHARLGRTQPS